MFYRKQGNLGKTLSDIVIRKNKTGCIFVDINNDLGDSCDEIMKSSPLNIMAYAYARRVSVAALFVQGLVKKDIYEHVLSIFHTLQHKTGHTREFQEAAADLSTSFMRTYHPMISGLFENKLVDIAQNYEVSGEYLADGDLFSAVIDVIRAEQESSRVLAGDFNGRSDRASLGGLNVRDLIGFGGLAYAAERVADEISKKLPDRDTAYQFILEELDGASMGNARSMNYAASSGISPDEYRGALSVGNAAVDAEGGPQQALARFCMDLLEDRELMAEFRCEVGLAIMRRYSLGVYSAGYFGDVPF